MKQTMILLGLTLAGLAVCARADGDSGEPTHEEATMIARGTFEVTVTPQPQDDGAGGAYEMQVTVVPDSGTDELTGIAGLMTISIEGGKHSYVFEYTR